MKFESDETEFIERFFKGDFKPELLFDNETSERLKHHPAILRTIGF